jgi:hypothetical protein
MPLTKAKATKVTDEELDAKPKNEQSKSSRLPAQGSEEGCWTLFFLYVFLPLVGLYVLVMFVKWAWES